MLTKSEVHQTLRKIKMLGMRTTQELKTNQKRPTRSLKWIVRRWMHLAKRNDNCPFDVHTRHTDPVILHNPQVLFQLITWRTQNITRERKPPRRYPMGEWSSHTNVTILTVQISPEIGTSFEYQEAEWIRSTFRGNKYNCDPLIYRLIGEDRRWLSKYSRGVLT